MLNKTGIKKILFSSLFILSLFTTPVLANSAAAAGLKPNFPTYEEVKGYSDILREKDKTLIAFLSPILDQYLVLYKSKKADSFQSAMYFAYTKQVVDYFFKNQQYRVDGNYNGLIKLRENYRQLAGGPAGPGGNPPAVQGKFTEIFMDPDANINELKRSLDSALDASFGEKTAEAVYLKSLIDNTDTVKNFKAIMDNYRKKKAAAKK